MISVEEDEAVTVFCKTCVSAYHRLTSLTDANDSIFQATLAIDALESRKTELQTHMGNMGRQKRYVCYEYVYGDMV